MSDDPLPPPPPTLGQIREALWSPCATPPWMMVGIGAFDAMLGFWTIVSPNWKDTYRAGGRGSWVHGLKEIMIDAEEAPPKWFIALEEGSIALFELTDLFLFWFMVGNTIASQLINWTSQIWELSGCKPKANEYYVYSKTSNGIIANDNHDWQDNAAWLNCKSNAGYTEIGPQITIPANSTCNYTQVCTWTNISGEQFRPADCQVVDAHTGEVLFHHNMNFESHDLHYSNGGFLRKFFTHDQARTIKCQFKTSLHYSDFYTWSGPGNLSIEYAVWDPS